MRFHIQNLKFRNQIVLLFSIIFLLTCAFSGIAFYHLSAQNVTDNFSRSAKDAIGQMENTLETRLGIIDEKSRSMLINQSFYNTLAQYLNHPSISTNVRTMGVIADYLRDFERGEELISSSYLYTEAGDFDNYISYRRQDFVFKESPFYKVYEQEDALSVQWLWPMEDMIFQGNTVVIPCVRRFTVQGHDGWLYFVYQLDQQRIEELISGQHNFFDEIIILSPEGKRILGHMEVPSASLMELWEGQDSGESVVDGDLSVDGTSYMVESCQININGWKLFALKSKEQLLGSLHELAMRIFQIDAVVMIVSMCLILLISKRLTDDLIRLEKQMNYVEKGDLNVRFIYPYDNEIGSLSRNFNYMLDELEDMVRKRDRAIEELRIERNRVEEVQKQKRKAELKALQAQINPHFLYNTLNAITWEAAEKGMTDASIMASSLGKFFRLSLSKGAEIISLGEEGEHVRSYLKIQGIRYKDKLKFEIHIPEPLTKCRTLKLILQPLVENAIYHGIKEKKEGGLIRVSAVKQAAAGGDVIRLEVWDNGVGIPKDKLKAINEGLKNGTKEEKEGYGIYNVNERVMIYYGNAYGLHYDSVEGEYTRAVLIIPVSYREE